jgi:hypothetical protein
MPSSQSATKLGVKTVRVMKSGFRADLHQDFCQTSVFLGALCGEPAFVITPGLKTLCQPFGFVASGGVAVKAAGADGTVIVAGLGAGSICGGVTGMG